MSPRTDRDETGTDLTIRDVKARHQERLMSEPGVVSVGIGKDPGGGAVIVVGLDRERPETVRRLPSDLDGYPVRTEIVGRIRGL